MSGKDIDDMTFEKYKFWTVSSLEDNYKEGITLIIYSVWF